MSLKFELNAAMSLSEDSIRLLRRLFGADDKPKDPWSEADRRFVLDARGDLLDGMAIEPADAEDADSFTQAFLDLRQELPFAFRLDADPEFFSILSYHAPSASNAAEACGLLLSAWLRKIESKKTFTYAWGDEGDGGNVFVAADVVVMDNPDAWGEAVKAAYARGGPDAAREWESGTAHERAEPGMAANPVMPSSAPAP